MLDLTDSQYLLTNWVSEYSYTPVYLLDTTRQSYNSHTVNLTSNPLLLLNADGSDNDL